MTQAEYERLAHEVGHRVDCPTCDGSGRDPSRNIGILLVVHPLCGTCGGSGRVTITDP